MVPFPPGGQVDTVSRLLIDGMRAALGQPLIVENAGGASGTIGTGRAVRAAPDGYTVVMGNWTSHVGGPAMYAINYDILNDLEPVAMLLIAPTVIVGRQTLPPNTLQELVAWLKANGDKATAATVGAGSPGHVSGIHFQNVTGTRFQFVPYRGGGPANQDLVGGQVDLRIGAEASQMLPHIRAGRTKGYAVLSSRALARLARSSDRGRSRRSGHPYLGVDRALGAERHARGISSRGSMPRWCRPWPIRPRASASPMSASRFRRATS